jgi:hypothetical protein
LKGRERNPNFLPTWKVMEVGDEKEGEEPIRLFLLPKELWKQETKGRERNQMDFSSRLNNNGSRRRKGGRRAKETFPFA